MVLELAGLGALDGPVAGVVHPRGDLVGQELATHVEELHREHADVVQVDEQARREIFAASLERGVEAGCRSSADAEDAALVVVLDQGPARDVAVEPAHGQHRQLPVERHQLFQDQRRITQVGPRVVEVGRRAHDALSLAVVPTASGLEHRGQAAHLVDGALEPGPVVDRRERGRADAEPAERLLLDQTVLRDLERPGARVHGHGGGEEADRSGRHTLPLVGRDPCVERDLPEGGLVPERPDHEIAHRLRRGLRRRVQEAEAEAERDAGQGEHAPELAAAEHRDQLTRRVGVGHPDLSSAPIG